MLAQPAATFSKLAMLHQTIIVSVIKGIISVELHRMQAHAKTHSLPAFWRCMRCSSSSWIAQDLAQALVGWTKDVKFLFLSHFHVLAAAFLVKWERK